MYRKKHERRNDLNKGRNIKRHNTVNAGDAWYELPLTRRVLIA